MASPAGARIDDETNHFIEVTFDASGNPIMTDQGDPAHGVGPTGGSETNFKIEKNPPNMHWGGIRFKSPDPFYMKEFLLWPSDSNKNKNDIPPGSIVQGPWRTFPGDRKPGHTSGQGVNTEFIADKVDDAPENEQYQLLVAIRKDDGVAGRYQYKLVKGGSEHDPDMDVES